MEGEWRDGTARDGTEWGGTETGLYGTLRDDTARRNRPMREDPTCFSVLACFHHVSNSTHFCFAQLASDCIGGASFFFVTTTD